MKYLLALGCGLLAPSLFIARAQILNPAARGIVETERAFARLAKEANTRDAFLAYFTDESLSFGQGLHKGRAHLLKETADDSVLEWAPLFVDVALSGDFGYDTGPWNYRNRRADASPVAWGTYVTVWRKQPDGNWRVALDLGTTHRPSPEALPEIPATSTRQRVRMQAVRGGDFRADLLTVERDFISRFTREGSDAFLPSLSTEARFFRPGLTPALSAVAISSYFETQRGVARPVYELIDGETASSGDLGYVYGWITTGKLAAGKTETKRLNYLRIWKREDGRNWKILLDLTSAN